MICGTRPLKIPPQSISVPGLEWSFHSERSKTAMLRKRDSGASKRLEENVIHPEKITCQKNKFMSSISSNNCEYILNNIHPSLLLNALSSTHMFYSIKVNFFKDSFLPICNINLVAMRATAARGRAAGCQQRSRVPVTAASMGNSGAATCKHR